MYQLVIPRRVQRAVGSLSSADRHRVVAAIDALATDPRPLGWRKLENRPSWHIRVGSYRVIYEIEDTIRVVTIIEAGHRRDVYR